MNLRFALCKANLELVRGFAIEDISDRCRAILDHAGRPPAGVLDGLRPRRFNSGEKQACRQPERD